MAKSPKPTFRSTRYQKRQLQLSELERCLAQGRKRDHGEMAKITGVGFRTLQDIEHERSEGSVQTMNRNFAVLGLKLGVVRADPIESANLPFPSHCDYAGRDGL